MYALPLYAESGNPEKIDANDMRTSAGKLTGKVLTVRLEARNGAWYPDGPAGTMRSVAAFAEEGKGLQNPGPLVRAAVGTQVSVTIRNRLEKPLWIFGLGAKRGVAADSFEIAPGAEREMSFEASEAGIFYYAGKTMPVPVLDRFLDDSQLNGAIVIDPPGAVPNDRLFLISWWGDLDSTMVSGLQAGATIVANGMAWPHTQRIHATQGEQLNWKWISVTAAPHPMHLHGFYFRIEGLGDGATYKQLAPEERPLAVTELMSPGGVMAISWQPDRPGNWIFHCHFAGHMTSDAGLNKDRRYPEARPAAHAHGHDNHFMGSLIVGIEVAPKGELKASSLDPRPVRLIIRSKPKVYGDYAGYSYVLGGSPEEQDANAMPLPGPTLVLEKDQPVAVTIVNHSHEPAAVHWHGIELESFPDGVPGVSGYGTNLLPAIAAHDSLTVRFTPPRTGTFMYHSHFNELQQLGSGLYGAIVVREPDEDYDPVTNRILLVSDGGPTVNFIQGPLPPTFLNGSAQPQPMDLEVGKTYRFRVINIRAEWTAALSVLDGDQPVEWRMIARDGADLPAAQVRMQPAVVRFGPGQIFDFEFTPAKAGDLKVRFGYPPIPAFERAPKPGEMVLRVR